MSGHEPMDLESIRDGGKRALARALAGIEADLEAPRTAELLDAAFVAPAGVSLGLTSPPGVGKSTLIDALIRAWRRLGKSIAVIAVDPSSVRSRGALLGDRTRLTTDPTNTGVFVRSMAARDALGGVAEITFPCMVLMRAFYDLVIVETVGVGQSEIDVHEITDLTAFCAQPGSGDALQYMKAGVMEVPDLIVVTKADMGAIAQRTASDLKGALSLSGTARTDLPVLACSAADGTGIDALIGEICSQIAQFSPQAANRREAQVIRWAERQISARFGRVGLDLVHRGGVDKAPCSPFGCTLQRLQRLSDAFTAAFQ